MSNSFGPKHLKAFRDNYLAAFGVALALLLSFASHAQVFPPNSTSYAGIPPNRFSVDSVFYFPTGCGTPTDSTWLFSQGFGNAQKLHKFAIFGDSCGHKAYLWDPSLLAWSLIGSGSGTTDSSIFATIARLHKISDSLGLIIGQKLNVTDSAGIYSTRASRQKLADSLAILINLKLNITDSSGIYTTRARLQKVADSLGILIHAGSTDSSVYATRARVQKAIDSLGLVIAGKVTNTGGANFLGTGTYASRPVGQGSGIYWAVDSSGFFITSNNGSTYTRMTDVPGQTFNLTLRNLGNTGDSTAFAVDSVTLGFRKRRDSIDFHHVDNPDSSYTDYVQAHDTTSANAVQPKYRSDTGRTNTYAAIPTPLFRFSDSICFNKNGIRYCVLDSAGGGGGTVNTAMSIQGDGSSGNKIQLVNDVATPNRWQAWITSIKDSSKTYRDIEENFLGTFYDSIAWANTGGFVNRGATFSATGGNLAFSAGANTFTQTAEIPLIFQFDNWTVEGGIIIGSKNANATDGGGIGKRSTNTYGQSSTILRFITGTGAGTGTIQLWGGSVISLLATSSTALSFSIGDSIFMSATRDGYNLSGFARDVTTNSRPIYVNFTYSTAVAADPLLDNTGRASIFSFGGTFSFYHLKVSSRVSTNDLLGGLGDSKWQGYAVGGQQYRISDMLNNTYRSTVNLAGGYDRSIDWSAHCAMDLRLHMRQLIITSPSNDPRSGIDSTTTNNRLDSLYTAHTNNGTAVFFLLPFHEGSGNNQDPIMRHMLAAYPGRTIDGNAPTKQPGSLYSDSIHLLNYGDSSVEKAVVASGLIYGGNTRYGSTGGAGNSIVGTTNAIPKFNTSSTIGNSSMTDNGTHVVTTEAFESNVGFDVNNLSGATDAKIWNVFASGNTFNFAATNDAKSVNNNFFQLNRSGATPTNITFQAPAVFSASSGIPISITPLASTASISMVGFTITGFFNPFSVNGNASAGISTSQFNTNTSSSGYSNFNIGTNGITGANSTVSFYNSTTARYWVTGQRNFDGNYYIGTGAAFFSDFGGTNFIFSNSGHLTLPDTTTAKARISYSGDFGSSFTQYSVIDKNYADSMAAAKIATALASVVDSGIAVHAGSGLIKNISGTTITLQLDSTYAVSWAHLQKVVDSLGLIIAAKASLASPSFTGVPLVPTASPLTNSTQAASTAYSDAAIAALGLASGTYFPSLTGVANVASSTSDSAHYQKNGNQMAVWGSISGVATAGSISTTIGISLPPGYTSHFSHTADCAGPGSGNGITDAAAYVTANVSSNIANITYVPTGTGSYIITYSFCYTIK